MDDESRRYLELDGVRGLAILLVVVYHVFDMFPRPAEGLDRVVFSITSFGWVGVDLFFVLSGFLITGILLRTKDKPGYFQNFFARRALRILPLYYGFLLLLVALSYFNSPIRPELQYLQSHQAWYWLHVTNWLVVLEGDYSAVAAGYLWSLSVEEQFYLIWPIVVMLLDRKTLDRTCATLFVASLVGRYMAYYALGLSTTAVYSLTFTHLEPLLVGASLALLMTDKRACPAVDRAIGPLAMVATFAIAGIFVYRGGFYFWDSFVWLPGGSLLAIVFGWLIFANVRYNPAPWKRSLRAIFRNGVFVSFGKYSYAIYLFHMPVAFAMVKLAMPFIFGKRSEAGLLPPVFAMLLTIAISWMLGYVSFYCYERPFLRLKRFFDYRSAVGTQCVVTSQS